MNTSSLSIYLNFLRLFSILYGPQIMCWVWVFCQNTSRTSTACLQDHLACISSLQARVTLWNLGGRALHCLEHFLKLCLPFSFCSFFIWIINGLFWSSCFNYKNQVEPGIYVIPLNLLCEKPFWTIFDCLAYFGPFWSILDQTKVFK